MREEFRKFRSGVRSVGSALRIDVDVTAPFALR